MLNFKIIELNSMSFYLTLEGTYIMIKVFKRDKNRWTLKSKMENFNIRKEKLRIE